MLLALSAVFVAYIVSGFLAHPDWGAAARGLVVPSMPLTRDAVLAVAATVGTTLAPWGLAFIQSYAVDKRLTVADLRYERVDVVVGAVLTGVIGLFVVVACAATLHASGMHIDDAGDAAQALEPLAGRARVDAVRRRASSAPPCWPPRSSRCRPPTRWARRSTQPADLDDRFREAPLFYGAYGVAVARRRRDRADPRRAARPDPLPLPGAQRGAAAAGPPVHAALAPDREVMGEHALGLAGRVTTGITLALVAVSVVALAVLTVA